MVSYDQRVLLIYFYNLFLLISVQGFELSFYRQGNGTCMCYVPVDWLSRVLFSLTPLSPPRFPYCLDSYASVYRFTARVPYNQEAKKPTHEEEGPTMAAGDTHLRA